MEIKETYYKKIGKELLETFPEFQTIFELEDGNYPIFGEFSRFMIRNIDNTLFMNRLSKFISRALHSSEQDVVDLILIEIFEPFYDCSNREKQILPFLDSFSLNFFNLYKDEYLNMKAHIQN